MAHACQGRRCEGLGILRLFVRSQLIDQFRAEAAHAIATVTGETVETLQGHAGGMRRSHVRAPLPFRKKPAEGFARRQSVQRPERHRRFSAPARQPDSQVPPKFVEGSLGRPSRLLFLVGIERVARGGVLFVYQAFASFTHFCSERACRTRPVRPRRGSSRFNDSRQLLLAVPVGQFPRQWPCRSPPQRKRARSVRFVTLEEHVRHAAAGIHGQGIEQEVGQFFGAGHAADSAEREIPAEGNFGPASIGILFRVVVAVTGEAAITDEKNLTPVHTLAVPGSAAFRCP